MIKLLCIVPEVLDVKSKLLFKKEGYKNIFQSSWWYCQLFKIYKKMAQDHSGMENVLYLMKELQ